MGVINSDGIFTTAQWIVNSHNGGGTYATDIKYPWRICWHEIQGSANRSVIEGHASPPHLWYAPSIRKLYQTVPLSRSAFALYHASDAPYETNKARTIQIEIEGYSDYVANEPIEWLDRIAEDVLVPICQWVAEQGGSIDLLNTPGPFSIPGSARADAPQRFSPEQWRDFNGVCCHAHVPMGDDHWDTGAMDIQRISQHAAYLIGALLDPTPKPIKKRDNVPDAILHDKTADRYIGIYPNGNLRYMFWSEVVVFTDPKNATQPLRGNISAEEIAWCEKFNLLGKAAV